VQRLEHKVQCQVNSFWQPACTHAQLGHALTSASFARYNALASQSKQASAEVYLLSPSSHLFKQQCS
jgi:hypothetical protein